MQAAQKRASLFSEAQLDSLRRFCLGGFHPVQTSRDGSWYQLGTGICVIVPISRGEWRRPTELGQQRVRHLPRLPRGAQQGGGGGGGNPMGSPCVVQTDGTSIAVVLEGQRQTKTGYFWPYLGDAAHPYVVVDFSLDKTKQGRNPIRASRAAFTEGRWCMPPPRSIMFPPINPIGFPPPPPPTCCAPWVNGEGACPICCVPPLTP